MEAYLLASLLVAAGLACIPASIAKNKGYSFGLWWFYGWMLFIVAIIHVSLIPDKKTQQIPITPSPYNPLNNGGSKVDELKKYKELMDQGVITEEEFQTKKEQILNLPVVKKTVITGGNSNIASILKRAFMFLEDKEWSSADGYCEAVLDIDPECAEAYLGKLMASLKVSLRQELKNCATVFDNEINFQKAMRFADDNLKKELQGYIDFIVNRNITDAYNEAIKTMEGANSEEEYKNAAAKFQRLNDFKDSVELAKECFEKAEESRLTDLYNLAISTMNSAKTEQQCRLAAEKFNVIKPFKDAEEKANECMEKSLRLAEENRIEAERLAKEKRIALEKARKKRKKNLAIATIIGCVCIAIVILFNMFVVPIIKYNNAIKLMESESYGEAIATFQELGNYGDADKYLKYCSAKEAEETFDFGTAASLFSEIEYFLDSRSEMQYCYFLQVVTSDRIELADAIVLLKKCEQNDKAKELLSLCEKLLACEGDYIAEKEQDETGKSWKSSASKVLELDVYLNNGCLKMKTTGKNKAYPWFNKTWDMIDKSSTSGYDFSAEEKRYYYDYYINFSSSKVRIERKDNRSSNTIWLTKK